MPATGYAIGQYDRVIHTPATLEFNDNDENASFNVNFLGLTFCTVTLSGI